MIPVKLKILKLFIGELSNMAEGEAQAGVDRAAPEKTAVSGENGGGWETDEDEDEDWEEVGDGTSTLEDDVESESDILKGVDTTVAQ